MDADESARDSIYRRLNEATARHDQRAFDLAERERFAAWVENFPVSTRRVRVGDSEVRDVPDVEGTLRDLADAIRRGDHP